MRQLFGAIMCCGKTLSLEDFASAEKCVVVAVVAVVVIIVVALCCCWLFVVVDGCYVFVLFQTTGF